MNAIEIMEKDHSEVKSSLDGVMASSGREKRQLFNALKRQLEMHNRLRLQVLYPAVKSRSKAMDFHGRYKAAHEELDRLLDLLDSLSLDHKDWNPAFLALRTSVLNHFSDQETHLFESLRGLLSVRELQELGKIMDLRKRFDLKHS
jgi:hypothetical protein